MTEEQLKDIAHLAVREAEKQGADYAEARVQGARGFEFLLKNGEPQPSVIEDSLGIGIRLLYRGALAFSATNVLERSAVRELARGTIKMAKVGRRLASNPVRLDDSHPMKTKVRAEEKESIDGADPSWLSALLTEIEKRVKGGGAVRIPNRFLAAASGVEEKYYVNSDGARVETRMPRVHFFAVLTAIQGDRVAQRMIQHGQTGGMEVVRRLDLVDRVEEEARTLREVIAKAAKPPTGVMDVLLSPELSGIAAHESVGHPQEADRILGREGAQAGESYLKKDSLRLKIGSAEANVSDDPTLEHSNGYSPVDEEGVKARKRRLIVGGKITEFLHDRSTSAQLGANNNGSSRAVGFDREPIIRMSNTFVEPGDYTTEELVKEVREGIYLKSYTEWNIDDKRLNQRYVGLEAYQIRGGEVRNLVREPVLEITTPALWGSVKGRSKRLEFEAAVCGKGDPMQGAPVWTGGPDTLLAKVRVGTR